MNTCKHCGADMRHSPCCGRVDAYGDMKESLRLEVLENERLRTENARLNAEVEGARKALQEISSTFGYSDDTMDRIRRLARQALTPTDTKEGAKP